MKSILLSTTFVLFTFSLFAQSFTRSELPTSLSSPWEITYGQDGYLWITEAGGIVSRVHPTTGSKTVVFTASDYFGGSPLEHHLLCHQPPILKGTLGLALHPDFLNASTAYIYFVYSYNSGTATNPITKFRIKRLLWDATNEVVISDSNIVDDINSAPNHVGGRLLTIKQNGVPYLFLTTGDNGISDENNPDCYQPQSTNPNNFTQDVNTQNGKVHRFNMDGSIPTDNPISGNSFYTRGHRNPQGLMYNDHLNILYDVEHGDRTDDEINVLEKGMNYGWKTVRGYHSDNNHPGEAAYVANYTPHPNIPNDALKEAFYSWCSSVADTSSNYTDWCTVAPSDGIYYGSNGIPEWENSLLVVTLKNGATTDREVYQFKLQANGDLVPSTANTPNPKRFFGSDQAQNGRLRDITYSPDGKTIYLINTGGNAKITVYTYDSTTSTSLTLLPINALKIFPNPVKDILTIQNIDNLIQAESVEIITPQGVLLPIPVADATQIDVSYLVKGIYVLRIIKGKKVYMTRFVKL